MKFYEKLMIDEYEEWLDEAKKDKYMCISGKRGCYWSGNKPIKDKDGGIRCPVCGGPAGKNYIPDYDSLIKMRNKQIHKDLKNKYKNESEVNESYKVAQNPDDKLWYVLGSVGKHWMPISDGKKTNQEAEKYAKIQPKVDKMAKGWVSEEKEIDKYIKSLKNKNKKEYALKYKKWKDSGEKGGSPDRGSLSVMGAQAVRMSMDPLYESEINEAPLKSKGWDESSLKKFGKSVGKNPKDEGFFEACVLKMKDKPGFDEKKAQGFCASIKDAAYGSPNWRGKGKTKSEVKKDTKEKQY